MKNTKHISRVTFWKGHIQKWHSSGLSQLAYCKENGIGYCSFNNWKNKLPSILSETNFVEIPVNSKVDLSDNKIEFYLLGEVIIKLQISSPDEEVKRILRILVGLSC